ncbi:MAG: transposase family protein [Myxococcota bacterium]|nr:transposase family protein [Myxococcota bacterium]
MSAVVHTAGQRALVLEAWAQARAEGRPCAGVAALFRVATGTIRRWARQARSGVRGPRRRGRPRRAIARAIRQGVIAMLLTLGPSVGVSELRSMFGTVPHRRLGEMKRRLLAVMQRRKGYRQRRLAWMVPGATWAMDFTKAGGELEGDATHLLAVCDLASGMKLALAPSRHESADVVRTVLERLFLLYGAPLVIKHDGGGAFTARETRRFLRRWGVLALRSPARMPSYNGSCERHIGWAKVRVENVALLEGHAGRWPRATIERARGLLNTAASRPGARTPRSLFERRPPIPSGRRRAFKRLVLSRIRASRVTHVSRLGRMPTRHERDAMRRKALERALCRHGYLQVRRGRISTPVFGLQADAIM